MPDETPDKTPANPALLHTVADYQRAKEARARWQAEENRLKAELLETLGYSDDEKPTPQDIVDPITGVTMFSVKVGKWRGMDFQYLKETYPHIYAECELSKPTVSIKIP